MVRQVQITVKNMHADVVLRTLEGAEYFLGRRLGLDAEEKAALTGTQLLEQEAAALGLLEDLLAV